MEDFKINPKKDLNAINHTTTLKSNNMHYSCSECQSVIEIIKLDEKFIGFKCKNNHNIKMNIKEYLDKIREYNNILNNDKIINNSICNNHNKEYLSYCFECNMHLCKKCLKSGKHRYHYKIYIMEILPDDNILKEIKSLIKNNQKKIKE